MPDEMSAEAHPCLAPFVSRKVDVSHSNKALRQRVRAFHEKQNEMIDNFVRLHDGDVVLGDGEDEDKDGGVQSTLRCNFIRNSRQAAAWSLAVNILLLIIKAAAAGMSGSLAIISTVVESALDLLSGTVFFLVSRHMNKRTHLYPVGKKRFEPLAVIFVASVMGTAALQVAIIAIQSIVQGPDMPTIDVATIVLVVVVIATKGILYIACRAVPTPAAQALAADHINDIVSNITVLACVLIARHAWVYADPLGAVVVSIFIVVNWSVQGLEQVRNLAGRVAPPELLQQLTWIALHHSNNITQVDTVRGYGYGNAFLVEIDIVLPEEMPLRMAHDIGESLQLRAEKVPGVERAFVHLDFTTEHKASDEHNDNYHEGPHSTTLSYAHIPRHTPDIHPPIQARLSTHSSASSVTEKAAADRAVGDSQV